MKALLTALSAVIAQAAPVNPASLRELIRVTDALGFTRSYLVVPRRLSDAQLTSLGRALHAREPQTWFWLFDDAGQAAAFVKTLPRTLKGDLNGYPLNWVERHTVAHIALALLPNGARSWVLIKGAGLSVEHPLAVLGPDR